MKNIIEDIIAWVLVALIALTLTTLVVVAAGLWGKFILVPAVEWVETL